MTDQQLSEWEAIARVVNDTQSVMILELIAEVRQLRKQNRIQEDTILQGQANLANPDDFDFAT